MKLHDCLLRELLIGVERVEEKNEICNMNKECERYPGNE